MDEESINIIDNHESDANNNNNNNNGGKSEKYSLRPRSLRQKTEKGLELKRELINQKNKKINKPKSKPPPLSKYRRKTANARERNRMREINIAFETLRRAVPHISGNHLNHSGNEKLTKITTLRLAMKYIQTLRHILDNGGHHHHHHPDQQQLQHQHQHQQQQQQQQQQPPPPEMRHERMICDDQDLDILLSDGESLHFNSDISESFASPDHPIPTSPLSEPSDNSPIFPPDSAHFPENNFSFQDNLIISDFPFDDSLTSEDFF